MARKKSLKKQFKSRQKDYAQKEYGVTAKQLKAFEKRIEKEMSLERKRGTIVRFSGDLEKDLA